MKVFNIVWSVVELVNGMTFPEDGLQDGEKKVLARGECQKEADSASALKRALLTDLRECWPETAYGPTYNLERFYEVEITPVEAEA